MLTIKWIGQSGHIGEAKDMDIGRSEGRTGTYNQWVIDNLMEYDVTVIDMYDKIYKGTFIGGNLTTALKNKTKNENGGAVIWGGIRDTELQNTEDLFGQKSMIWQ